MQTFSSVVTDTRSDTDSVLQYLGGNLFAEHDVSLLVFFKFY